jgi:hypothetical protein
MAASEVIREFLARISYSVDEESERRYKESLKKTQDKSVEVGKAQDALAQKVKELGLISATTAATFAAGIFEVAKNYEQLYYVVQRTSASAEGLAKLQYAFGQVGLSGDAAVQMILRMTNAIKASPGLAAVFRGVSGDDWNNLKKGGQDATKALIDFLEGLKNTSTNYRAAIASMFGMSQDELERLISQLPELKQAYADAGKTIQASGVDQEKFLKDSAALTRDLRTTWMEINAIWQQSFEGLFGDFDESIKRLNKFLAAVLEFNKIHPFAAVLESLAAVGASVLGVTGALRVMLGLVGLGGGAAAAGAGAAAAGGAAAAAPAAAAGVGAAGAAEAAAIGALGAGVAAGGAVALYPSQAGNKAETDAESLLWAEAKRRAGIKEQFGPPAPAANGMPGWLDWLTRGGWKGAPHFQGGGIVPINAHAGEAVLPREMATGLMSLYAGGENLPKKSYEAMSNLASNIYQWLRGGAFAPRVVPIPEEQFGGQGPPFSILDAMGRAIDPSHVPTGAQEPGPMNPPAGPEPGPDKVSMARQLFEYGTKQLGLGADAVKAMLANAWHESGLNPIAIGRQGEHGLFQWLGSRWTAAKNALGDRANDPFAQFAFAAEEMKRIAPGFFGSGAGLPSLVDTWMRGFENPANKASRMGDLNKIEKMLQGMTMGGDANPLGGMGAINLGVPGGGTALGGPAGNRTVTLNQTNNFNVGGGTPGDITGRLTRIADRLAGDTIRNSKAALA